MKKLITLLALSLCIGLVACEEKKTETTIVVPTENAEDTAATEATAQPATEETTTVVEEKTVVVEEKPADAPAEGTEGGAAAESQPADEAK